jgi:hypothetical protein
MSAKPSLSGGNFVLIMIITVDIQHPGIVAAWAVCSLPLSICFRQEQGRELGRLPTVSCGNGATAEPCLSWLMCRLCQPKDTGRAQIQALEPASSHQLLSLVQRGFDQPDAMYPRSYGKVVHFHILER